MNIHDEVRELISNRLEIEQDKISEVTTFDELGADSLDLVDVIADIESEYEVEISDEEIGRVKTVEDIEKLLSERI